MSTFSWTLHQPTGDPIPLQVSSWTYNRTRGESIDWSIEFVHGEEGVPNFRVDGPLAPLFAADPHNADWTLRKWLRFSVTVGAETYNSPPLVPLDFQVQVEAGKMVATCSGSDQLEALLAQDEFMTQLRSVPGTTYMAKATIEEILEAYQIDNHSLLFDDYGVQQLNRVGSPMDWIRQLLEVRQAWLGWEGDTLVARPGGIDTPSATADFTLNGNQSKLVNFRRSARNVWNEVLVQRVGESLAAMDEPDEGAATGFVTVTLDRPVNMAALDVTLLDFGTADQATWFDEEDNEIDGDGGFRYIGPTKVAKVRFVLAPKAPSLDPVRYRAMVYGFAHNEDFGEFDSDYSAPYADTADQALRGRRKYKRPLVNSLVPSGGVGLDFATRWVREALRGYCTAAVDTLLEPSRRPGLIGAFTLPHLGLSSYKMQLESVRWAWTGKALTENLELSRGAA